MLFPEPEGPATTSGLGGVCDEEEEEDLFASVCLEAMSTREEEWFTRTPVTYVLLVEAFVNKIFDQ